MGDISRQLFGAAGSPADPNAFDAIFSSEMLRDLFPSGDQQVENERTHIKREVFHYWTIFKNSAQYLKLMESQLRERQRARILAAALPAWRAAVAVALRSAGLRPGQRGAWNKTQQSTSSARSPGASSVDAVQRAPATPESTDELMMSSDDLIRPGSGGSSYSSSPSRAGGGLQPTMSKEDWSPSSLGDMLNPSANPRSRRRMGQAGRMGAASGYRRTRRVQGSGDSMVGGGGEGGYRFLTYFTDPYTRYCLDSRPKVLKGLRLAAGLQVEFEEAFALLQAARLGSASAIRRVQGAPTDRLGVSGDALLEMSDAILEQKWPAVHADWERPPAPKNSRLLSTIANNKSWVMQQLKTGVYFWRRYTRHHMWRRQRHESSLRFSNWLKKLMHFKRIVKYAELKYESQRKKCKVLARMSRFTVAKALGSWRDMHQHVQQRKRFFKECLRKQFARFYHRSQELAFEHWLKLIEQKREQEESETRRLSVANQKLLQGTFGSWEAWAETEKVLKNALTLLVFRRAHRLCLVVTQCWRNRAQFMAHVHQQQMKALGRMHFAIVTHCFDRWHVLIREAHEYRHFRKATAWTGWLAFVKSEKTFKALLRKSVWRWQFHNKLAAFRRWRVLIEHARFVLDALIGPTVARSGKRAKQKCFAGWLQFMEQNSGEDAKLRRAIQRMQKARMYTAWDHWAQVVDENRSQRHNADRLLVRHARSHIRAALIAWSRHKSQKRHHRLVVLRRTQKYARSVAIRTLRGWYAFAHHEHRLRRRVWATMTKRGLTNAFHSWNYFAAQERRRRRLYARGRAAFLKASLLKCFNAWLGKLQKSKTYDLVVSRCVRHLLNRTVASGFNAWLQLTITKRRIRNFLNRWTLHEIYTTFKIWATFTVQERVQKEWVLSCYIKLQRVYKRQVFEAWRTFLRRIRDYKRKIAQVAVKMGVHSTAACFISWAEWWRAKRDMLRQQDHLVTRLSKLGIISAWARWCEFVGQMQSARGLLGRFSNYVVARAWNRWVGFVNEIQKQRQLVNNILGKMSHRGTARAFLTWKKNVARKVELFRLMGRAALKMRRYAIGRAYRTWCFLHSAELERKQRRDDVMQMVVRRLLHRKASRAFEQWAFILHQIHVLRKFAKRLLHWCLWRHLKTWKLVALNRRHRRYAALGAFLKMRNHRAARAMRAWQWRHEANRHALKVEAKAVKVMMNLKVAKSFRSMRCSAVHTAKIKRLEIRAFQRLSHFKAWKAFDRWTEFVSHRLFLASIVRKMQRSTVSRAFLAFRAHIEFCSVTLDQAFHHWHTHATVLMQHRLVMMKTAMRWFRRKTLRRTVSEWRVATAVEAKQHRKMRHAIAKMIFLRYVTVMSKWHEVAAHQARCERLFHRAINSICMRVQTKVFTAWKTESSRKFHHIRLTEGLLALTFGKRKTGPLKARGFTIWLMWSARVKADRKRLQVACRILDRSKIVEAFKRWLWYVDLQWDRRRMVESNMQNMALEFAIRKQKGSSKAGFF